LRFRFIIMIAIAMHIGSIQASSDVGFIIQQKNFTITLRLGIADIGENDPSYENEIIGADKLFFSFMQWTVAHRTELRDRDNAVTIYLDMTNKEFGIESSNGTYTGNIEYTPDKMVVTILNKVESLLGIQHKNFNNINEIPLFIVRSSEYIDTYRLSDIYFGSIPSYMYSHSENNYLLLKWEWDKDSELARQMDAAGATVHQTGLTRELSKKLLDKLD